jgi:hypothetical protein
MSQVTFYSSAGAPVAYTSDGLNIYLFNGTSVAYIHDGSVYSFGGRHLGRYANGWIRDNNGACVFYTEEARGGPVKPVKHVRPVKGVKSVKPVKSVREVRPVKAVNQLGWSRLSGVAFFQQ